MKYKISLFAVAFLCAALLCSCKKSDAVRIDGHVSDLAENDYLVLKRLDFTAETLLDTLRTDESGHFGYSLEKGIEQPGYYYLYVGDRKIASLILKKGDRIKVNASADGGRLEVEGSEDSELLRQVSDRLQQTVEKFDSIYVLYKNATGRKQEALSLELGSLYVKYKQEAIRFLYAHPRSFVNTSVVFHTFPGQFYVFSDATDAPLLRRVYDSLYVDYPLSPYVMAVRDRYESMEKSLQMEQLFSQVDMADFPDLCLPGLDGQPVCLSSLSGKVIVLSFWHSANVQMRLDNRELIEIYDRYAARGLEIYQVALDTNKAAWATAVRDQSLPWIGVCDGLGTASPSVVTYNIETIPTFFVINKQGDIIIRSGNVDEVIRQVRALF
ncbi:MAG: Thiol-disulfide oxidoreductase ResA [Bacteroidetes bacterium ADurb.Bin037]|nr:MAG: Thiol-disulfide oxidoreductase ResA [Bacteroidetes bacterium ADurb.Bin037]HPW77831.1 TlpA disulfide reductase family protein [Bacteroidales bacterium]HQB55658.1 TlpA disulfide reductase family protein [Bacteroidales bacterium]